MPATISDAPTPASTKPQVSRARRYTFHIADAAVRASTDENSLTTTPRPEQVHSHRDQSGGKCAEAERA